MIGFPKLLVSKQDYLNAIKIDPKKGLQALQALRNGAWTWQQEATLEEGDEGRVSDSERVDSSIDMDTEQEIRVQMVYREDTNAEFYRIGFTKAEYTALMQDHTEE